MIKTKNKFNTHSASLRARTDSLGSVFDLSEWCLKTTLLKKQACRHMLLILALTRRQQQADLCEFQASRVYLASLGHPGLQNEPGLKITEIK